MMMIKKIARYLGISLLLFIAAGMPIFASEGHGRDIDSVVEEILLSTQSPALSEVSPQDLSPELLEELGDAVMGLLLNSDWQHERMDAMLGGEGSSQLAAYHRDLGEAYIESGGSLSELRSYGGGWMMPGGMMGFSRFTPAPALSPAASPSASSFPYDSRWDSQNFWGSQGRWNSRGRWMTPMSHWTPWSRWAIAGSSWMWGTLIIIAAAAAVLATAVFLGRRRRRGQRESESQAMLIARNRFAKGEISKQEFDRMKSILR